MTNKPDYEKEKLEDLENRLTTGSSGRGSLLIPLVLIGALGYMAYNKISNNHEVRDQRPSISAREHTNRNIEDTALEAELLEQEKGYIQGFGRISVADKKLPVFAHGQYQTESGDYIVKLGASSFLIDGKTGKLQTTGSHTIRKDSDGITITYGTLERKATAPLGYNDEQFSEDDQSLNSWIREEFEERDNGLYVRHWKENENTQMKGGNKK